MEKESLWNLTGGKTKETMKWVSKVKNPHDPIEEEKRYSSFEERRSRALRCITANEMLELMKYKFNELLI